MTDQPKATFSADEVVNLAGHQTAGSFHPFTCANRGDGNHRNVYGDLGALVPTVRGWICPFCDYTQNWAHAGMKAGSPDTPSPETQLRGSDIGGVPGEGEV